MSDTIDCFCGEQKFTVIKKIPYKLKDNDEKAKVIKCNACGLMRTSPSPLLDKPDLYEVEDVSNSHSNNIDLWRTFSQEIVANILKKKNKGRLLDIGCNIGILVDECARAGFESEGIDLNEKAILFGKENINKNLRKEYLEKIDGKNVYDVIVMNHVIEHISDLKNFMIHIRRLLKRNGIFIAICPNAESGIAKTLHLLNKRKSGKGANWFWYGYLPDQHVWQFGPKTLNKVIKDCGLDVYEVNAKQNMHWGASEGSGLRFKLMSALWKTFKNLNMGDNLYIYAGPNK